MSDFYGTLIDADAYHLARGNTGWAGTDDAKNAALLRGSEYIDTSFRSDFGGYKTGERAQLREWPRSWATDDQGNALDPDVVPDEVPNATYEAALRELVSPNSLQPDYNPAGQQKSVKVDVIAIEYTAPHGVQSVMPIITVIRGILAPILTGTGSINSGIAGRAVRT
jgi:hypothetical protein